MLESVSPCWVRVILREILQQFPRRHHVTALGRATTDGESQNAATIQHGSCEEDFPSGVGSLNERISQLVAVFWARTFDT